MNTSPDPLRELLYKISLGTRYLNSVWTPLTIDPCGAQVNSSSIFIRPDAPSASYVGKSAVMLPYTFYTKASHGP